MQIKSLYISTQQKGAGSLFVTMGMMEMLKKNLHRVAFFRPIIASDNARDYDIDFILNRYALKQSYEDACGFEIAYVESMIASGRENELINELIGKFKKLEESYDFVLCEGIRRLVLSSSIEYDLNLKIAQNFSSGYINIINAKDISAKDIYEDIRIEYDNSSIHCCSHFATFVNRLDEEKYKELFLKLKDFSHNVYLLEEVAELDLLTIEDILDGLDAKCIFGTKNDYTRVIKNVKVAALTLDNFLYHLEEDDLVIVPADRSDIILGLFGALYSKAYPSISGIVFPFAMKPHENIKKLLDGLSSFSIPILSVEMDTYTTAHSISKIYSRIRLKSERKIALALGLFERSVDVEGIERLISSTQSDVMTPQMFEYRLFDMAKKDKKRIVLPEASDERVLRAAEIILRRGVAEIILLGDEQEIRENSTRLGVDLSGVKIVDNHDEKLLKEFSDAFYEMRRHKGLSYEAAADAMIHLNYFGTMMVHLGYADGMVSGAIHSTSDTIRPALQIIKTTPDVSIVSSVFFMCLDTKVLVYGDCAVNQDPDAKELCEIALASAETAKNFSITPKVAMLSYSTGESGSGADVDKVREATKLLKQKEPELLVEGPIQYDAAVNKDVAKTKLPNSKVAGDANVLIFPDLNTGNNTYKAVQRSSGAIAIGPVLQGLNKPINDLSRGCLVSDIVNTIAITAIQAQGVRG
ncbi:MAG: phosphate acetyltransferase [Campylobacterales bacterium]|nr:phosphate acetyltransferase [Campylobacterales bacterium]